MLALLMCVPLRRMVSPTNPPSLLFQVCRRQTRLRCRVAAEAGRLLPLCRLPPLLLDRWGRRAGRAPAGGMLLSLLEGCLLSPARQLQTAARMPMLSITSTIANRMHRLQATSPAEPPPRASSGQPPATCRLRASWRHSWGCRARRMQVRAWLWLGTYCGGQFNEA